MKLSFIFELLLIFVLIAFAASAAVGESGKHRVSRKTSLKKRGKIPQNRQDSTNSTTNRFCNCSGRMCNCCREFNIPVLPLKGPGCASLQYLSGDRLAISMSFGDRVLTNTTISGRRPQPVCMPLPGGVSKFCGRVYNIGRQGDEFNACLGLELRALNEIEAALRVSCFRFGPKGLRIEPPQPLPILEDEDDDEDDDDDDDEFDYDDADSDYGSFGVLDDDFIGGYFEGDESDSSSSNKKKVTSTTITPLRRVTKKPIKQQQKKPLRRKGTPKPVTPTKKLIKTSTEMPAIIANETTSNSTATGIVDTPSVILESSTNTQQYETTESTVLSDVKQEATTKSSSSITKNEDDSEEDDDDSDESSEEDEEDDPIADAVDDALDDEESAEKSKIPTEKSSEKPEESKEVLEDIVDSVVDTVTGEESDESRTLIKGTKSTSGRQSHDMQLEQLH